MAFICNKNQSKLYESKLTSRKCTFFLNKNIRSPAIVLISGQLKLLIALFEAAKKK